MSALDTTCFPIRPEIDHGAGEMKCVKPLSPPAYEPGLPNAIASEIINEILDNAMEIVLAKGSQMAAADKISPNMVGDILDNILSTQESPSETCSREDETALLDDEIKKIIKEMKCPPAEKPLIGVGDQLVNKNEVLLQETKRNTLERKNRLTNLVRNSKQMLSKFVTGEQDKELKYSKSEETHEKLLKIIDLEPSTLEASRGEFSVHGCCKTAPGVLQFPFDSTLDLVDLENKKATDEEKQEEEIGSCMLDKEDKSKQHTQMHRKNKWSFATKIMKYLRRKENKSEQASSKKD